MQIVISPSNTTSVSTPELFFYMEMIGQFEKDYLNLMVAGHGLGMAANPIGITKIFV